MAHTFFDASFCNNGLHRFLQVDSKAVLKAVDAALPEYDAVVVMVNSPLFGGSGEGQVAVCSREARANDIALHELGHAAFDLADEYSEGKVNHRPIEPSQVNVTIQKTLAKFEMEAVSSPLARRFPRRPTRGAGSTSLTAPAGAGVGTYEGARRFKCRVYRPAYDCKMRNLHHGFCEVCQAHITKLLTPYLATT